MKPKEGNTYNFLIYSNHVKFMKHLTVSGVKYTFVLKQTNTHRQYSISTLATST